MRKSVIAALSLVAALLVSACGPKTTTCVNPLTYTDIPDSDIIRVGDDYYMVSTTMYYCPGAPIMKSRDLVHWRLVNYVYDCLEDDDIYNMRDGGRHAYGSGQWATSLRYENGLYYALFIANDQRKTYVYTTDARSSIPRSTTLPSSSKTEGPMSSGATETSASPSLNLTCLPSRKAAWTRCFSPARVRAICSEARVPISTISATITMCWSSTGHWAV